MSTPSSTASIRPPSLASRRNRRSWVAALAAGSILTTAVAPAPALAQWAVYDAKADMEALLAAARQVQSLANEAQQLANDARSLAASPYSHLAQSSQTLRDIGDLARSVRGTASTLQGVERQFADLYPDDLSLADLTALEEGRAGTARRTAEDVARAAAELERLSEGRQARLSGALTASEAAEGETAAIQSSTQVLAVLAEDLASMRAALLAQSRLLAEQTAREAAARDAGLEARRRLWRGGAAAPTAPGFDPLSHARD